MYCLISMYLCFLQFFSSVIDTKFHSIVVGEDAWYDFTFLKFTEVWFVTQDVVYPGECFMCTWEEGVFFCIYLESPEDTGALYQPRGGKMGREMRGRFKREGIYVYLWLNHVEVWRKRTKFWKAIILQLKNK